MKSVLVMLSTYCGERFVREQLDSLLEQEGVEVRVLVRDDGSSDGTKSILKEYVEAHTDVITVVSGENIGWRRSFFELLSMARRLPEAYDYYAFCDQDDIWLPKKLCKAVERIATLDTELRLYCSNLYYYKNGVNRGEIKHGEYRATAENCLIRNYATGCTIVFNRPMLEIMTSRMPKMEVNHDTWAYQVAVLLGSVYIDKEAYILYRQHEANQIGIRSGWREVWSRRLRSLRASMKRHDRERQAQELERCFADIMPADSLTAVRKVARYRSNPRRRLSLATDCRYTTGLRSNDFWLRLRILAGKL